jgi:hypothetical protein
MRDPRDQEIIDDLKRTIDSQAKGIDAIRKVLFTSTSGICSRLHIQNCHVCEREDCCDNTNPQIARLKAAEAVVEAADGLWMAEKTRMFIANDEQVEKLRLALAAYDKSGEVE